MESNWRKCTDCGTTWFPKSVKTCPEDDCESENSVVIEEGPPEEQGVNDEPSN